MNLPAIPKNPTAADVVAWAEQGAALIRQAETVDHARKYRAEASAIEVLVRQMHYGKEAIRHASALKLRAERRIGQLTPKETGGRGKKLLAEEIVSPVERSTFRKLAEIPEDEFEAALADAVEVGAQTRPTRKSLINLARANDPKPVRHPARFSDPIMEVMAACLGGYEHVLDPFAGTGRIHQIADAVGMKSTGVELEPEWAALHERTAVGDARHLDFADGAFDAVATSPCYGNRYADHHVPRDGSERRSYTHDLGRPLSDGNAGMLQWGPEYREFHEQAWAEVTRVLAPGGRFVLNISDHMRDGERMPVNAWHVNTVMWLDGYDLYDMVPVATARMRKGENAEARPIVEYVFVFDRRE